MNPENRPAANAVAAAGAAEQPAGDEDNEVPPLI